METKKEAFSDGVSSHSKSWYEIVKESADKKYTNEQIKEIKTGIFQKQKNSICLE